MRPEAQAECETGVERGQGHLCSTYPESYVIAQFLPACPQHLLYVRLPS